MGGMGRERYKRGMKRECVSVRGGKRNKERGVGQGLFECVRGRERKTRRGGR
jgi:hypothetical protein